MTKAELRTRTNILNNECSHDKNVGLSENEIDYLICKVYHMHKDGFPQSFIRREILQDALLKSAVCGMNQYQAETFTAEHQRLLYYLGQYDDEESR